MLENLLARRRRDICDQRLVLADTSTRMCFLFFSHSLQSSMESPNLEFEYGDTDALTAELSGKAFQSRGETVSCRFSTESILASSQWSSASLLSNNSRLARSCADLLQRIEVGSLFSRLPLRVIVPSELYSYTEEPEFAQNRDYFEEDFRSHGSVCVCACVSEARSVLCGWTFCTSFF